MTKDERQLCRDLTIYPNGLRKISKEDFVRKFPFAVEHGKLSLGLLEGALRTRNREDLECALTIGFTFGFATDHANILCGLIEADWHNSHEDVVSALDELRAPGAVDALYRATQWIPKTLEYDDSRALAVKAIWALGKIPGFEAETKLETLAHSDSAVIKRAAVQQLERRHKGT